MGVAAVSVVLGYKFAAIPEWVLYHPDLTGDDIRVFGVLARYGNDVRPALGTIAAKIGKSEQSARRSVHRLAEVGALRVQERFEEGAQLPNRYHLAGDEPLTDDRGGITGDRGVGSNGDRGVVPPVVPEREQDNESNNNETKTPLPPASGGRSMRRSRRGGCCTQRRRLVRDKHGSGGTR